jgi:hypothetical protein
VTGREVPDDFEHDDAAYVLGALSAEEREAFEAHLTTCADCTHRVRELAGLPGMLTLLSMQDVIAPDPGPVPDTLLLGLLRRADAARSRRRWVLGSVLGVAAASLLALVLVLSPFTHAQHASTPGVAMTALVATPVTATAVLSDVPWGTRIQLDCRYSGDSRWSEPVTYVLQVVDRSGRVHDLGSWALGTGAGAGMTFVSGTGLTRTELASVQISLPDGTPILRLST